MKRRRIAPIGDTASKWTPPEHVAVIAEERTGAIRREFLREACWSSVDFKILAQSCYMQGMNDMVDAALKAGWIPGKTEIVPPAPDDSLNFGDMP